MTRATPLLLVLFLIARPVPAQFVEDPILSRGQISFQMDPASRTIDRLYGGTVMGQAFFVPELGSAQLPALEVVEARFQALADDPGGSGLRLGATRGRFSADAQVLPLRVSYGLLERVTLGLTVPFVRSRVDSQLRLIPEGANVGLSPNLTATGEVSLFLAEAGGALAQTRSAVEASCLELGEESPECTSGRALVADAESFLLSLDDAYTEETLFPLEGSSWGSQVAGRWGGLRERLADWGAEGPLDLPLASEPPDDAALRSLVVNPAWPGGGFPLETPPAFLELGDVALHLSVGVLDTGSEGDTGVRVRGALVGTARFPTGQPDSLRAVAPGRPPRGVTGVEVRWVSDMLLADRFAVLGVVEGGWNGTREMVLLAPDAARPFTPGATRASVRWQPGTHMRLSLTPRVLLGPALSLGGGWHMVRRGADSFAPLEAGQTVPEPSDPSTVHSLAVELRFTGLEGEVAQGVRFPFEVLLRGSRSLGGSGDWAPAERRIEAGLRFLVRR